MDCCDRFALWLAELTLDRVRALADGDAPESVTVGASCQRRRFRVTIHKEQTAGGPSYRWDVRETPVPLPIAESGSLTLTSGSERYGDPEEAYWVAWGTIDGAVRAA
jgi:hypothetical protein